MFASSPIYGMGIGNYFTEYGNYQANYFLSNYNNSFINIAGMNYHPFNEFVRILVENGIIGLCVSFAILILIALKSFRILTKRDTDVPIVWVVILIIIFGFSCVSYLFSDITIIIILLSSIGYLSARCNVSFNFRRVTFLKYSKLVILCVILSFSITKIYAINMWRKSKSEIRHNPDQSLINYKRIYPILCNNASFLFNYGIELKINGNAKLSQTTLIRASYYGNSIELYTALGDGYLKNNDFKMAESSYLNAAYMVPKKFVPFNVLLNFYIKTHQPEKASAIAKMICNKPIKIPSLLVNKIKWRGCNFLNTNNVY